MPTIELTDTEVRILSELVDDELANLYSANSLLEREDRPLLPSAVTRTFEELSEKLKEFVVE